ncbi:anti-sigma B factor, putative [Rhodobacteraceae bacterium KLH11]|nr:anti-sigma B factor, putative [Rhodobacteraceae bacterium KLH11]
MASNCKRDCLDLTFTATEAHASAGIATLSARLAERGLPASKSDDVKIALAEAINNVVEHAYAGVPPSDIQVNCCLCEDRLMIQITDSGNPMPGLHPPKGAPASVDTALQDLPEGGFGWFLIHQLASEIHYERQDGGNLLCLRFDFDEAV